MNPFTDLGHSTLHADFMQALMQAWPIPIIWLVTRIPEG